MDEINGIECDKILVEFLRVNGFIKNSFGIDYSPYTLHEGNYRHLPLWKKMMLIIEITGFDQITVCDDKSSHFDWFHDNINANKDDCCNLRRANIEG